jgi:hypothetical protein
LVNVALSASSRTSIAVRAVHCLGKSGRLAQAMDLATEHLDAMRDAPDCFFTLGDLWLDAAVAHPLDAMGEWLRMAQAAVHEGLGQPFEAAHYLELSQNMQRSASRMSAEMPEQVRAPF